MQLRKIIIIIFIFLFLPLFPVWSGEHSYTGFYYPLKDDNPVFEQCGRWLERSGSNGCYYDGVYHLGSDMMVPLGTNVYAVADGVVKDKNSGSWGNGNVALVMEHKTIEGKFLALYGHITSNKNTGDEVRAGEKIGEIGYWSGGNHLHFGVLSPGLDMPSSYWGRWPESQYGIPNIYGYYDNGFIDPIWFLVYKTPDNWITKSETNSASLNYPISPTNPYFYELCINTTSPDSRCSSSDMLNYIDCAKEKNSACAPTLSDYSAISGGGGSSGCPECAGGDDPGDTGATTGPDGNIKKIQLDDTGNNWHHTYTVEPGETLKVRATITNKGDEIIDYYEVKIFRSNDRDFDKNQDYKYSTETEEDDLNPGDKDHKHETITAPTTPGTYYIFGYINQVDGEQGGGDQDWNNNYSRNDDPEEYGVLIVEIPPKTKTEIIRTMADYLLRN